MKSPIYRKVLTLYGRLPSDLKSKTPSRCSDWTTCTSILLRSKMVRHVIPSFKLSGNIWALVYIESYETLDPSLFSVIFCLSLCAYQFSCDCTICTFQFSFFYSFLILLQLDRSSSRSILTCSLCIRNTKS